MGGKPFSRSFACRFSAVPRSQEASLTGVSDLREFTLNFFFFMILEANIIAKQKPSFLRLDAMVDHIVKSVKRFRNFGGTLYDDRLLFPVRP